MVVVQPVSTKARELLIVTDHLSRQGDKVIVVDAIVVDKTLEGVDVVMGIDAINQLGVTLGNGIIKFGFEVAY